MIDSLLESDSGEPVRALSAVLLCAGRSERMGRTKALLPWGDRTLLEAWVGRMRGVGVEHVAVVLGPEGPPIRAAVPEAGFRYVDNPQAGVDGMRESLLIGLDALPADALAFFTPIDVPVVGAACIAAVRDAWIARDRDGDTPLAALPSFRRRHGHPVLAGPDFVARLFEGQRGDRVDELLAWATRRLAVVDLDDGRCVRDMDTPEDYSAFAPSPGASWDAEPPAWDVEQTLEIKAR